jgi:AraC-like DNA-binding protein/quercetin dioxygenase-like cupin family protein
VVRRLVNPVELFSGAKLADVLLVDNVVVFKRTSTKMLKPQGVTHNYHHRFELVVPLQTAGRIHVEGIGYTLAPGQVFLIFPHQFHHYLEIEGKEMLWLFITFELARPDQLLPLRNSPRQIGEADGEFVRQMLKEYVAQAPGSTRSFSLIVRTSQLLQSLLGAREADCAVRKDAADDDPNGALLFSINRYVRANLDKSLTIADLARHTGYSISHLRAVFRREFGISLGGYMRDSRLSIAASMLARPERDRIENIAKACGFESIFSFSRAFKKSMGCSPRDYSKLAQAGARTGIATESDGDS